MVLTENQISEMKKTYKGKWKLWKLGVKKFREDPPIYRIHLMQGLMTKLTIYMIIFASIYAISIGLWVFALIIIPVGIIGNYYSMKSHFIKYKNSVKQYQLAGILKPINKDPSNLRRRWRTIENKIGFFGVDIIFTLFLGVMCLAYFGDLNYFEKFAFVFIMIIPFYIIYFKAFYDFCGGDDGR